MSTATCGPIDFIFLQDLSGSYSDDLPILKSQVPNLIAATDGAGVDIDFGVASFIDKPTGPFGSTGDYVYQTHLGITTDNASVVASINSLATLSGADGPEAQLEGLLQTALRTAELGYRDGATRVVMLSTDSTYHVAGDFASAPANNLDTILDGTPAGTGEDYPSVADLRAALLAANIFPVFSVTAAVRADYEALVTELGFGAVVTLTSDSLNFSDAVRTALGLACGVVTHQGTDLDDSIDGTELEDGIFGGLGDDTLNGLAGDDIVDGGAGMDSVHGDDGMDDLRGGSGNDELFGDGDDDTLSGGLGDDTLTGGTGADRFVVNKGDGIDVIADFEDGIDLLDLSSWDKTEAAQAVTSATETSAGDVLITFVDGSSIRIIGLSLANFDLTDVILSSTNAAPLLTADTATTVGTDPVVIDALLNDTDIEGDTLTITSVGTAAHGTAELLLDGTLRYTADLGFVGVDSFIYVVSDGALTASTSVSVTVERDLTGDAGDNYLVGSDASELLEGFEGNDTLVGLGGDDTLDGGTGDDSLSGGSGRDSILGGDGADNISGGPAASPDLSDNDTISGGAGNDTIDGGASDDIITGDGGDDVLDGGAENDQLNGGAGNDLVIGGAGHDEMLGGSGNDTLDGGAGDDQMDGGNGNDIYLIDLNEGDDIIQEEANPATSSDTILFGSGIELADLTFSNVAGSLLITIAGGGSVEVDGHYDNPDKAIEFLHFADGGIYDVLAGTYTPPVPPISEGDDTITGTDGVDAIDALGGNDLVHALAGDDDVDGGAGADTILGGVGNDRLYGRSGNDELRGEDGHDTIMGGTGKDLVVGGAGSDLLKGGGGGDRLVGNAGDDDIYGGKGRDKVYMGTGNDTWWDDDQVAFGDDLVVGGAGNDVFHVGAGNDTMSGGADADTFYFADLINNDIITDFELGVDALRFSTTLWNGLLDQARLDALATPVGADLVFAFDNGDTLTLEGVSSTAGLLSDIALV